MEKRSSRGRPPAPVLTLRCKHCGIKFERKEHQKRSESVFCSRSCALAHAKEEKEARERIDLPEQVGTSTLQIDSEELEFIEIPYFPSLINNSLISNETREKLITPICQQCKFPFVVMNQGVYPEGYVFICGPECRRKYDMRKSRKTLRLDVPCGFCGNSLSIVPSRLKKRNFCSKSCFREWQKKEKEDVAKLLEYKIKKIRENQIA